MGGGGGGGGGGRWEEGVRREKIKRVCTGFEHTHVLCVIIY